MRHRDQPLPSPELPLWLRGFFEDVVLAVKIHDTWPTPGHRPLRCHHPETLRETDAEIAAREHWEAVLTAVRRGERVQIFEGLTMQIDPTPEQVDMAFRMIARMAVLDRQQRRAVMAGAKGRPFWKLWQAGQWIPFEVGLWRMATRDVDGAAV